MINVDRREILRELHEFAFSLYFQLFHEKKTQVIICLGERKSSCHGEKEILMDVHDHCSKSCAKLKEFTLNLYCNVRGWDHFNS